MTSSVAMKEAFATVITAIPDAVVIVSRRGEVEAVNPAAARMWRRAPAELSGRSISQLVAEDAETVAAYLRSALRNSSPIPGSLTLVDAQGAATACRCEGAGLRSGDTTHAALLRLIPKHAAANRFIALNQRIDELAREIARRQRAEVSLREQTELLRVTLSSIGDAVIATDAQGRITFLNEIAERLTGWSASEALGSALADVFLIRNEATGAAVESPVAKVLREGTIVGLANHTILRARQGGERPIDDSGAPIRDAHGRTIGVVLVFRDVTERRAMERERRAADRRKDEFLAMLAHELRNPLAALGNGIQYMAMSQQQAALRDPALTEVGKAMQRQLRNLTRLVDDLVDVSRVTTGKIVIQKIPIPLQDIVKAAVEICQPSLSGRRIHLGLSMPADPMLVEADSARLSQVFCNLVTNAIKFSEPGAAIELRSTVEGTRAVTRVRDYGAGIPAEMLHSIFELFVQADTSLARPEGGLGVGLTVAKAITELHGGSIEARSEGPGRGSEFMVALPLAARRGAAPRELGTGAAGAPPDRRRIVVVDDNDDAATTLAHLLRMVGHEVRVAHSGTEALRLCEALHPAAVLLDLGMPGMDGYETARHLRERFATHPMLIIAVTGYGSDADRRKGLDAGFDHHLTKPVDAGLLQEILKGSPC